MAAMVGSASSLGTIDGRSLLFLILSGLATGASWLCYFAALARGDVSRVAPIDKLSTVLAILLALILLSEPVTAWSVVGIVVITAGTLLMVDPDDLSGLPLALRRGRSWLTYALASALFAALTSILGKVGISGVDPTLGTAVRTLVVLAMAWVIVAWQGRIREVRSIPARELAFIIASGAATCASWLAYYHALKDGPHRSSSPSTSCRFSSPLPSRQPCFTSVSRGDTWLASPSCARARRPWWWRRTRCTQHHTPSINPRTRTALP